MVALRYVLLGLSTPRSDWSRTLSQWATSASVPVEFVQCLSAEELRARLATPRTYSGALLDGSLTSVDRDLIETARASGCPSVVVDRPGRRDWRALGVAATLPERFGRDELLAVLKVACVPVGGAEISSAVATDSNDGGALGPLYAVCGSGGTGASTLSIALAQGLGSSAEVVLADLALRGQQAMLHDSQDVVPSIQELAEASRGGRPSREDVRSSTFSVMDRRYHLLLGLRRPGAWATIRPRAFSTALDALRSAFDVVVADIDSDVEGEREGGSLDVEERNTMSRTVAAAADVVVVVATPGMKGLHSAVALVSDLVAFGVPATRLLVVCNRAPRTQRGRSELARAFADLAQGAMSPFSAPSGPRPRAAIDRNETSSGEPPLTSPTSQADVLGSMIFLPERSLEAHIRDVAPLPEVLVTPLVGAVRAIHARVHDRVGAPKDGAPVAPGSLGHWTAIDPDDRGDGGTIAAIG